MNPLAILTFLKSETFKYAVIALVIAGIVYSIYHAGQQNVQQKWDAATAAAEIARLKLKDKEDKVTAEKEIVYVDRIKTVTLQGKTRIEYIDRYITAEVDAGCVIPKNVIMLHDSAIAASILSGDGDKK